MKDEQKPCANSKADQHPPYPNAPVTPAFRLIVIGHRVILLPLRLGGKSKWDALQRCDYQLSRQPFSDVCRASAAANGPKGELVGASESNALQFAKMNPDKLFDYLDGRLSPKQRAELEEQLMSDEQLRREFAVARQIHAGMRGESREVVLPAAPDVSQQGGKMAIRLGVAFMVLVFVNVGIGLYFIFWHESKNPNRPLLEAQMREQIAKSIEQAATLTPAPNALGVTEITIAAGTGQLDAVGDKVVAVVSQLGGSATKGVPDAGRVSVLVDLPGNKESEFRSAIASIQGDASPESSVSSPEASAETTTSEPGSAPPTTGEKKSFVVQITEK